MNTARVAMEIADIAAEAKAPFGLGISSSTLPYAANL